MGVLPAGGATVVNDSAAYVVDRILQTPGARTVLSVRTVPEDQKTDGAVRPIAAQKITDAMEVTTVNLSLNNQRIINVADPIDPQDVATKQYVDTHGGGGGGGSGTVTSITAGTGLTGGTITVAGTIAVDFGTTAGKVTQGNDARLNPVPGSAGAIVYDNGTVYARLAVGSIGQVLKVGSGGVPEWSADSTIPTGPAGGSLSGTYPNPTIATGAITNSMVAAGAGILTSKLSGLLTDIPNNGLSAFAAASTQVVRTYYVTVNGNDTTGTGSISAPFASIQKAHDVAVTAYPSNEMVLIDVGPGSFTGSVNITRFNTLVQGQGHRAEMLATQVVGDVTVNPSTATQKYSHLVGLAGMFITPVSGNTAPGIKATGSGLYSLIVNDCYVTTNNAAATANSVACDATNLQRPRLLINDSILTIATAGPNIVQLDGGDVRINNTQILQGSSVIVGSAGTGIVVANAATLWLNGSLVETQTNGPGINATGSSAGVKLILTGSSVTTNYTGVLDTSHGVLVNNAAGVAAFIYQTTFGVADTSAAVYAITGSAPAVVVYGELTFQPGTNSAIASAVTLTPMVEKHATLNLPSLTASLPLQLDANKNVVAQALDMSLLTGTLPVSKGGTGISTIGGNGTVAYSNGTTLAYTDAGLAGYPLLSVGAGKPQFAALDLGTGAVTGILPKTAQAAQDVAGDVTGTTTATTVEKIQGRTVDATAPTSGQALVWSGSAWAPATISPGGGGGGGGGGLTYYMNYSVAGDAPLPSVNAKEMSLIYNTGGQVNTGAVTAPQGTYATLAEFVTDLSQPGATTISPGNWDIAVYLNLGTGANNTFFRARVFKWDGSTLTELSTSPSDDVAISSTAQPEIYTATLYIEQTTLTATERLVVRLEITCATSAPRSVLGYFGGNTPSHVHSTIGAPGGTGLVKVVDGIVQAPASLLVNADVSSLTGGTQGGIPYFNSATSLASTSTLNNYAIVFGGGLTAPPATGVGLGTSTQVLHGNASGYPTWGAVSLTSDVTGILPIANGGSGITSAGAAGTVVYSTGSALDFSAVGTLGQILTSGGSGAPVWISTVPIANGGTNSIALPTAGGVSYGTGTAYAFTASGITGQVLTSNGTSAPTWGTSIGASGSNVTIAGRDVGTAVAATITGASYAFTATTPVIRVTSTPVGTTTLTSTPTIAVSSITDGTRLTLINETSNPFVLQDDGTLSGSKVQLGGVTQRTLTQWQSIDLIYSNGFWIERAVGGSGTIQTVTASAPLAASAGASPNISLTGVVGVANGGTGASSLTANAVLLGNGTSAVQVVAPGTSGNILTSNGTTWVSSARAAIPYDVAGMVAGKPPASAKVFYFKATRAFTLSATAADHVFTAATGATGTSTFTVYKNALQILTATFASGGASPQVATISAITNNTIAVGDVISVVAPASEDGTLADVYWTLSGSLA